MLGTVNRGARWLDHEKLGWELKIHPHSIDLGSDATCILGQIYGHYGAACDEMSKRDNLMQPLRGFLAPPRGHRRKARMEAQWREQVERRMQPHREARAAKARAEAAAWNANRNAKQFHAARDTDLALSGD